MNPFDVVIVPSFYRPEFLTLCLEHLTKAIPGTAERVLWIFQDRHAGDGVELVRHLGDVRRIADTFVKQWGKGSQYVERRPHGFRANPYNFLEAYKEAYDQEPRYVYLVEEDVLVAPDFFLWHEAIQTKEEPFISVGWHCVRPSAKVPPTNDPHAYLRSYRDFASIGVCWRRENLEPLLKHATPEYYDGHGRYLARMFPTSPVPSGQWTEQAGLITRLLHDAPGRRKVCWAGLSRVAHIGIQGYHRKDGHKFPGNVAERTTALRRAVQSRETLLAHSRIKWEDVNVLQPIPAWQAEHLYCFHTNDYERGVI